MGLDEARFDRMAGDLLERIADAIDDCLGDELDVEYQGGIVTVTLPGGGEYVLNRHGPNRELWLSSPTSGAWHFAWNGETWASTRGGGEALPALLADELERAFGTRPEL